MTGRGKSKIQTLVGGQVEVRLGGSASDQGEPRWYLFRDLVCYVKELARKEHVLTRGQISELFVSPSTSAVRNP